MAHHSPGNRVYLLMVVLFLISVKTTAQYCDSITPTFNVDLSSSAYQSWVSPSTDRDGYCCGATAPDKCLEFVITLHPDAASVVFNIASGAVPPGALFYQIDCGPMIPVGSPICLSGTGPFHLTFCKPGNNFNTFSIETIPNPVFGPDITLGDGCQGLLYANFYDESSVTWTSVTPGFPGDYDAFLNCTTGCDTVTVTNQPSAPPIVGYQVCGLAANGCITDPVCDTIFTSFTPELTVVIDAPDTILCYDENSVSVSAVITGGFAPYAVLWDTGETSLTINATAGTHTITVSDQNGCVIVQESVTITQLLPPSVDAGGDVDMCAGFVGNVTLNGTAFNTSGVYWTGGNGTFSDSTALNPDYQPSPGEIASGLILLTLVSNDINGCLPVADDMAIEYNYVGESVALTTTDITCFGDNDGTVAIQVTGVNEPYSYSFDSGPVVTTTTDSGLAAGNHTVTLINSLGCDSTLVYEIFSPSPLIISPVNTENVTCNEGSDGMTSVLASGGIAPYTYSWNTTPVQNGAVASALPAGNYSVTATDNNGCTTVLNMPVTEPAALVLAMSAVPPSCYGYDNGAVSVAVTGGTGSCAYQWNTGQVATNVYDIGDGNYSVVVTDSVGCIAFGSVTVIEPPLLMATASNDTLICPGTPASLSVAATGGTGTYNYQWNPGMMNTASISVSPVADQLYTCVISDNNGCTIQETIMVTTEVMDPDDVQAVAFPAEICLGDSSVLVGSYSGTDPSVVLTWQQCSSCSPTIAVSPGATTIYYLDAENYCGQVITASVTVIVNLPPVVSLNPDSGELCPHESISFVNNGTNNSSWTYLWDFGDGNQSSQMNPVYSYSEPGIYTIGLTVTDNNGCTTEVDNATSVTVNPQADADFSVSSTVVSILDPEITFSNNSFDAETYLWDFGDGTSSPVVNPVHNYTEYGYYLVELWANNMYNCPDSAQLHIEVKPSFDIYIPNAFTPDGDNTNDYFVVQGYGLLEEGFTLEIYNRWGEVIHHSTDLHGAWDGTYKGGTEIVQDGVYTWVVKFRDLTNQRHSVNGHVSILK